MAHSFQLSLAFAILLLTGMSGVSLLVGFYQEGHRNRIARWARRLGTAWEFTVTSIGGFSWPRFVVASLLSLFLEMLLIRWIAAEVSAFAYFKNVVLIGCFLGFGLGCYLSRKPVNLLAFLFPIGLLVSIIKLPWPALREVIREIPYLIAPSSQITLLGTPDVPVNFAGTLSAILIIVFLFALVAFTFVPLGQIVGWCLEFSKNGIVAYTVNLLASLVGIALYAVLCFFYQPPAVWFAVSGLATALLLWKIPRFRWSSLAVFAFCMCFVSLGPRKPSRELWSPYQKITLTPMPSEGQPIAYEVRTNDTWYQKIINLSPEFTAAHPELFRTVPVQWNAYNVPYHFFSQPPSMLVLGSGTGNDVAAAVRNGAGRIVAVEIDPLILQIGWNLHFEKPYQSERVTTVLEDARSYIQNSREKFDLIVFSLLDSHTTSSSYSNIRIDNYVYTLEALQSARRLLKPDGIFIVKFWVTTPWIAGRLYSLMRTVFQQPPLDVNAVTSDYTTPGRFFISGSQQRIQHTLSDPSLRSYLPKNPILDLSTVNLTTDDWPYFYQRERGIPRSFALLSLVLALFCWRVLRQAGAGWGSFRWHFFFLGAGFMLLETQTVSKMALLFGTTWLVNSVVVGGLLLLIVAANMVVQRFPGFPSLVSYAGIYMSLAIAYFVPLERFFFPSLWLKALSATAVLCLPVFFAGMIFIRSFAQTDFSSQALGSNLFGALLGGLLEAVSYWTGIKSLLLLAAILYSASWLFAKGTRAASCLVPAAAERASA